MHRLCEYIDKELMEMERGVASGKKLSGSEIEYGDMLAHFKKSLLTNEAMEEAYEDEYSNRYDDGRRMKDGGYSYAPRKRDRMGRYSRDYDGRRDGRYSYAEGKEAVKEHLEMAMREATDEKTRREIQHMIDTMM